MPDPDHNPQLPEPRVPHVHGRDLVPLRTSPRRFADARQQHLLAREDAARARIAELDQELVELSIGRKALLAEIHAVHNELRPCYGGARGRRRRAVTDEEPLPPADEHAEWLSGRELRAICLSFLKRAQQALTLRQIHSLLHRTGYAIAHYHPVKVLADALGHEADAGRVNRVRRATYCLAGQTPPDDIEAALPDW
jgi:hypothetical protein